ncbi:ATP-binding protein [Candidatus Woesearchaeota archaeon]|nr:ATP-binding protein [Candidatus Woesearchaeota archaeon]
MLLGRITGKSTTTSFTFMINEGAKKFQYVQVMHNDGYYVLSQIIEIEKDIDKAIASCNLIGYSENGIFRKIKTPLEPGTEVFNAEDGIIKEVLSIESIDNGAYIGVLDQRENIKVMLDINKLLTKHIAVLAKSGSGKSYTVGVLLEEFLERNIPVIIFDPHGEYTSLKFPNNKPNDKAKMELYDLVPKGYNKQVVEYLIDSIQESSSRKLRLSIKDISPSELIKLLPIKLSNAQIGSLYSALKNIEGAVNFDVLTMALESEDNNFKWTIIDALEYLKKLDIFSESGTNLDELVKPGVASLINLKGVPIEVQEVIVYKLVNDLFNRRKRGDIPPFFIVFEEAQNFCPERNFGEVKSSSIVRQLLSEGRKFGIGACLITQRPARVDKTCLAQVTTQIILKITNPNDIRAVANSVEGITHETEKELRNIPIGTALVTGVVDLPLFVNIRPRKSKHGGEAVSILNLNDKDKKTENRDFINEIRDFKETIPVVQPSSSLSDLRLMYGGDKQISVTLHPSLILSCTQNKDSFNLLVDLTSFKIINDVESGSGSQIPSNNLQISNQQNKIFQVALNLSEFKPAELFSRANVQFSELYDTINALTNKGLLIKVGDKYKVNDNLMVFSRLSELAFYEKIEHVNIPFDKKLEKKFNPEDVVSLIGRFADIKDKKECFLVKYEIN